MGYIHPAVSEICDPQSLRSAKFLAHGQAYMGQMGKWPWQCTTRGLNNSTKLWMEKIRQTVTEIWLPQVWQPPARTVTTIPLQPGGLRGKKPRHQQSWLFKFAWIILVSAPQELTVSVIFHQVVLQVYHITKPFWDNNNFIPFICCFLGNNGRSFFTTLVTSYGLHFTCIHSQLTFSSNSDSAMAWWQDVFSLHSCTTGPTVSSNVFLCV